MERVRNTPLPRRPITSPEDQSATFVELFFDLVFVFAVTQVVGLLHDGLTWASVGRAILVFWLVWWAWTQFTWTLNAADTTHPWIELGTLAATAAAFFMAIALPNAFAERALGFAAAYVLSGSFFRSGCHGRTRRSTLLSEPSPWCRSGDWPPSWRAGSWAARRSPGSGDSLSC